MQAFRTQLGTTPEYNVITQYSGIQLTSLGSGTPDLFDVSTPPTSVNLAAFQAEVSSYLQLYAVDASTIYEVVLPSSSYYAEPQYNQYSCGAPATVTVCAFHTYFIGSGGAVVKYSGQPYPSCGGCQSAGFSYAESQEHFVTHETRETVTDSQLNGWYYLDTSHEADDECNWSPPPFIGTGGGGAGTVNLLIDVNGYFQ